MPSITPERWRTLSPHLDRALDLPEKDRVSWLAAVRAADPGVADDLEALLGEHAALTREGFLASEAAMPPGPTTLAGLVVGAYTLREPLGHGGMGQVWLAERSDGRFEGRAAVKLLNVSLIGRVGEARFRQEGSLLARLRHPCIAHLIDAGMLATGQPYLILEHVDGRPIDASCDASGLATDDRIRLFLDVLSAVAFAHANLVVHRDLKPPNILVGKDGRVRLLDFGIAKLLDPEIGPRGGAGLTGEGESALTPEYAAPEQLTGGALTTATDIYALGVVLYLLLTGQHPAGPDTASPAALIKSVVEREPPRPSDAVVTAGFLSHAALAEKAARRASNPRRLRRLLQGDLDNIVRKALRKDPRERYPSADAMADDLRRHLNSEPVSARPDSLAYRAAKFVRRNRAAVALASVALLATLGGLVGTLVQARAARALRDRAFLQLARAEAANDLNDFLLSDAAPSGKPFTVGDLLARAESILDRQRGEEISRVHQLIQIGREYGVGDEVEKSRRVLEKAYRMSRALADPSVRGQAACALALSLARGPDLRRAEPLVQEGLRELPPGPEFALDRILCLLWGGEVARFDGRSAESVLRVREAQKELATSPFRSELLETQVLMDLAEAYREDGRDAEALPVFEQAAEHLTALGRDDTQTAGTLYNNWALTLDLMGRPREAERLFRRVLDITRDSQGEEAVSPMVLLNYSRTLETLDRLGDAADYAERSDAKARKGGDDVVVNQSLLERSVIYRKQGDLDRAAAMLDEVEPRLRGVLPPGHLAFAGLTVYRAQIELARGHAAAALDMANQGMSMLEASIKAGGPGAGGLASTFIRRAEIELALHRDQEAAADAAAAVRRQEEITSPGSHSSILGRAHLMLGRALLAQGKQAEADGSFRVALEQLEEALGPDHPSTRAARELLGSRTLREEPPASPGGSSSPAP